MFGRPNGRLGDGVADEADVDLRAAYERGRRDERARRKRHPVTMMLTVVVAVAGAILLVAAAREGSFGRGGEVVDQNLSVAADRAEPAIREAVSDAGQAVQDAGREMRGATSDSAG